MTSELTDDFLRCFQALPRRVQRRARRSYRLWKDDHSHPGVDFKRVGKRSTVYSARVGIGWRVLGVKQNDTIIWFWIGSHAEYDRILKQM